MVGAQITPISPRTAMAKAPTTIGRSIPERIMCGQVPNRPVDDELELEEELELLDDEAITGTAALTTTAKIIEKKNAIYFQ